MKDTPFEAQPAMSFDKIAKLMRCSKQTVLKIHARALKKIEAGLLADLDRRRKLDPEATLDER